MLAATMLAATAWPVCAQPGATATPNPTTNPTRKNAPSAKAARTAGPLWHELDASQRSALAPLAGDWNTLHPAQKRKWLALSRNFDELSPAKQAKLHSRMTDWSALSARQRTQARLNYAQIKRLPADERKAKWEAYQALSEEEKRELAERADVRPPSAAAPARPVPPRKLAPTPTAGENTSRVPRIELAPSSNGAVQLPTSQSTPAR